MSRDDRPARDLSDAELIAAWKAQEPTDRGTSPQQDELAAEIERRGASSMMKYKPGGKPGVKPVSVPIAALFVAVALTIAPSPAHCRGLGKQVQQLINMTPSDFQRLVSIKDDSLEVAAIISTEPGFKEKQGLLGVVWNDNFLRAIIDKKSGETVYQVVETISYTASSWRLYQTVNYETLSGSPAAVALAQLGNNVDCVALSIMGGCKYTEAVAFTVDEPLLVAVAQRYLPSDPRAWRFRFKAQAGEDFNDGMVPAEVAGLLAAVRAYKTTHSLP